MVIFVPYKTKKESIMKLQPLFFTLLLSLSSQAQNVRIQATVGDFFTGEELDSVLMEVMRPDSTVAYTFQSKSYGMWNFHEGTDVPQGDYILKFTRKDYEPLYIRKRLVYQKYRKTFEELGKIYLKKIYSRTVHLGEVVIKPTQVKMIHHGDTIIYNADAFNLPEGSMLDQLVRVLPGTTIDRDGQIFVNGKKISSLMLNGNDFFRGNPKMALDNLPAYTIKNIKVYERQSDRDMALGMDKTGRELPTVMDVNLKKQYSIGWMGSVEGGYGTDDHYMGRLFLMRFSKQSRIALFADLNDLGDDYSYVNSGRWNENRLSDGLHRSVKGGVDIDVNDKYKRYSVNGNVTATHHKSTQEEYTSSIEFYPTGDIFQKKAYHQTARQTDVNSYAKLQLTPKTGIFIQVSPYANYHHYDNQSGLLSADLNMMLEEKYRGELLDSVFSPMAQSGLYRRYVTSTLRNNALSKGHSWNTGTGFELSYRPKNTQDRLTVNGDAYYGSSLHRSLDDYDNTVNNTLQHRYKYSENPTDRYRYHLGASYSYVLRGFLGGGLTGINLSYDYTQDYTGSHRPFYDLEATEWDGKDIDLLPSVSDGATQYLNLVNSYHSNRLDRQQRTVLSFDHSRNWLQVEFGLPLFFANNRLGYQRGTVDTVAVRHKLYVEPYATLKAKRKKDRKERGLELKYNLQYRQPDLLQTLDYRDDATPLIVRMGNANLQASTIHNLYTRLYMDNYEKLKFASLSLYAQKRDNALCQAMTYDAGTGVRTYRPQTINGNWQAGMTFDYQFPQAKMKGKLTSRTSVNYYHNVDLSGQDATGNSFRNTVRNTSVSEKIDYMFYKGNYLPVYNINATAQYMHSESPISRTMNLFDIKVELRARVPLPWKMEAESRLNTYIHCGYQDHNFNTTDFIWSAYIKKSLLKNRLYVKLEVFDILNQSNSVQYTLNTQMQTEVYRNSLRRYAMLSMAYNLTKHPKKK